jgi:hypothetical protein
MQRWMGPWDNPNVAGTMLAAAGVVAIACWCRADRLPGRIAAVLLLVAASCGLLATGSRAGLLALGAGTACLALGGIVRCRDALIAACTLVLAGLLLPGMWDRIADVGSDQGLADRFQLWSATLAICWDHPHGLGAGYMDWLECWYLDESLLFRFASPLNSSLALLAGAGFAALGAALWALATCAHLAWAQRARPGLGGIALAVLACLLAGAQSQGHHLEVSWSVAAAGTGLLAAGCLGWRGWQAGELLRSGRLAACWAIAVLLLVGCAAWRAAAATPIRTDREAGLAWPRAGQDGGTLVLASPDPRHAGELARRWGRRAVADGWWVMLRADPEGLPPESCQLVERYGGPTGGLAARTCRMTVLVDPEETGEELPGSVLIIVRGGSSYTPIHRLRRLARESPRHVLVEVAARTDDALVWKIIAECLAVR